MNLLAIETASSVCSVALFLNDRLVDVEEAVLPREHAEKLPVFVKMMVEGQAISLSDLDGIAVSIGPGSFTGLRIGLSYSKGLAFSSDLCLVPIPTLQAIAFGSGITNDYLRCILHSHRDFVYYQDFKVNKRYPTQINNPVSDKWERAVNTLPLGRRICHYDCEKFIGERTYAVEFILVKPSARHVGELAIQDFDSLKKVNFSKLEPQYISHFKVGTMVASF